MSEFKANIIFAGAVAVLSIGLIASFSQGKSEVSYESKSGVSTITTSVTTSYKPVTITTPIVTSTFAENEKVTETTTTKVTSVQKTTTQDTTVVKETTTNVTGTKTMSEYKSSGQEVAVSNVDVNEDNVEWIEFNCSAYCTCEKCTGGGGITASGTVPQANWTIAASKSYPFGTLIYIEGYGTYCVEDRGGAINNNKLDIYFATHEEACNFGRQQLKGYVVRWGYSDD